jgi:hypothetical protein
LKKSETFQIVIPGQQTALLPESAFKTKINTPPGSGKELFGDGIYFDNASSILSFQLSIPRW